MLLSQFKGRICGLLFLLPATSVLSQSKPDTVSVKITNYGFPGGISGVTAVTGDTVDLIPGKDYSIVMDPPGGQTTTMTLSTCSAHIYVKEDADVKNSDGTITASSEGYWYNKLGSTSFRETGYVEGPTGPIIDPPIEEGSGYVQRKFTLRVELPEDVEEEDPLESQENEGGGGDSSAGPPSPQPVFNSTSCCSSALGTTPGVRDIDASTATALASVQAVAHYEFPFGGEFRPGERYGVSLGALVFKADLNANLAQNWHTLINEKEGRPYTAVILPTSAAERGVYQTYAYVLETRLVNGAVIIKQFKKANLQDVFDDETSGIAPIRKFKIEKITSPVPCYQFSHFKGNTAEPYRVDRYFATITADSSLVRWEFDDGKTVESAFKKVESILPTTANGNYSATRITNQYEDLELVGQLLRPVRGEKTEHDILRIAGHASDSVKLNFHVSGVGDDKKKLVYAYDYSDPTFVGTSSFSKADTLEEYQTGSDVQSADNVSKLQFGPWLNVSPTSQTGLRLGILKPLEFTAASVDETYRYYYFEPGSQPYTRYQIPQLPANLFKTTQLKTQVVFSGGVRYVRKLNQTTNILGNSGEPVGYGQESPSWRQSVEDYYAELAHEGTIYQDGYAARTSYVPGKLFRRIQRSGATEVFSQETDFVPSPEQAVDYPAAEGPHFTSSVETDLLVSTGTSAFSPGSAAVRQPFKTTRRVTVRGRHKVASETEQVWTGSAWATLNEWRYGYGIDGKLLSKTKDGAVIESHSYPAIDTEVIVGSDGVATTYVKTGDGSITSQTRQGAPALGDWEAQPDVVTTYTETMTANPAEPNRVKTVTQKQTTAAGGLSLESTDVQDVEGSPLSSTDPIGVTTTYSSGAVNGYATQTQSRASGVHTLTSSAYLDGQRREEAGTGQVRKVYTYAIKATAPQGIEETETIMDGLTEVGVNKRLRTGYGELLSETVNGVTSTYAYDECGRVVSKTTAGPGGNRVYRYTYDYRNLVVKEGYDFNNDGQLTANSEDVFTERERFYELDGAAWWLINKETSYLENGSATAKLTVTTREKQGTGAGSVTQVIYSDLSVETTTRTVSGKVVTTTTTSDRFPGRTSTQMAYNGLLVSSQDFSQSQPVEYRYDALGRQVRAWDKVTNQIRVTAYDSGTGQVNGTTNGANEKISYAYYPASDPNAGRLRWVQNSAAERTYYAYNLFGQITHQWGNGSQPLRYSYDGAGQLQSLDTFKTATPATWTSESLPAAFASSDYSRRSFVLTHGRLQGRTYGQNMDGVEYLYNADGSTQQRIWAGTGANLATTYSYDAAGKVTGINYADGTPDVAATYDRAGRLKTLSDAAGAHAYVYQPDGDVQETVTGGVLDGLVLTKRLNSAGKVESMEWSFAGQSQKASYTFDSPMRLKTATLGPVSGTPLVTAEYDYHPDTARVQTLTRPVTGGLPLIGTFVQDSEGRPDTALWKRGTTAYGGHDYQLNAVGRRAKEIRLDGTRLEYGYNSRGELKEVARKRMADGTTRPDWTHEYTYDDSGNRATSKTPEGETLAHSLVAGSGTTHVDYTSTAATKHWLRGRANAQAEVLVGGQAAAREGEVWRYLLSNPASPAAQRTTVTGSRADLSPAPSPASQTVTIPAATTSWSFDERGNLRSDAQWAYEWDLENRLISQEQKFPGIAGDGAQAVRRLEYAYDAKGRRISKKVLTNERGSNGSLVNVNWAFQKETVFVWQDWTLVAEFVRTTSGGSLSLRRGYLWGLDVTGTFGGAGGVGGLLWVADYAPGVTGSNRQLAPWYDGNGNVMGWVENEGAQTQPLHRLEYDPYGKLLVEEDVRVARTKKQRDLGVGAEWLERPPFGFSTKYEDVETGLSYYGYRYYAPEMGRWLSRDPIGENGGVNLHGMVGNDSVNFIDQLGLAASKVEITLNRTSTGYFAVYGTLQVKTEDKSIASCCGFPISYVTLESVGVPLMPKGTYTPSIEPENSWTKGSGATGSGLGNAGFTSIRGKIENGMANNYFVTGEASLPKRPKEMLEADYQQVINQEFHSALGEGRNIHFGPTTNHSTGCVLVGTRYTGVRSRFNADRFGLVEKNGLDKVYEVPGFVTQDTIDAQFKFLKALQCAKRKGATIKYQVVNSAPPLHPDASAIPERPSVDRNGIPNAQPVNF